MAVQSSFYGTNGELVTFPQTKHIQNKDYVRVFVRKIEDNSWILYDATKYDVINNSIVFDSPIDAKLYNMIEIRVADSVDELTDTLSDIAIVASNIVNVNTVAENIDDVNNFGRVYYRDLPSDPTTRPDGTTMKVGDLYFNSTNKEMRVYDGSNWKTSTDSYTKTESDTIFLHKSELTTNVDTIASFRQIFDTPKLVHVSGYHTKDDGAFGSHMFRLREGVTPDGTYDNGGTVIETVNGVYDLQHDGTYHVSWFGALADSTGTGTGTDNSTYIQKAIDAAVLHGVRTLHFGPGGYRIASQLVVQGCRLNLIGNGVMLYSDVTGDTSGLLVDGFAILFDGWRDSQFNLSVNFSGGSGGIALRCRTNYCVYNNISSPTIIGGDSSEAREDVSKIAIKFIGNEAVADSTAFCTYYNYVEGARISTAYKLVECVVGDGSVYTQQPNAQNLNNVVFDRYIIGFDTMDSDEHSADIRFCNNAEGVPTLEGGFTYAFKSDGVLNKITIKVGEPGSNSRPFYLSASTQHNTISTVSNFSYAGINEGNNNTVVDRDRIDGLSSINGFLPINADGEGDINIFGNGQVAHPGAGISKLVIFSRNGAARKVIIGWDAISPTIFNLIPDEGNAINISPNWNAPIKMGNSYFWVHLNNGKLYTKYGSLPNSETDGYVIMRDFDFANLPTVDPLIAGQLWNNNGVVTISAG